MSGRAGAAAGLPPAGLEDPNPLTFSSQVGGPLYRFYLRSRLASVDLDHAERRIVAFALLSWLPLAILAAFGSRSGVLFVRDLEMHLRFLAALPVLVGGELYTHRRLREAAREFSLRGLIRPEDSPRFATAIAKGVRLCDSVMLECLALALVYTLGQWLWRSEIALESPTWYASPDASGLHLTPAGWWYAWVSVPLFQFLLLRSAFRLFAWHLFLWRVRRLDLQLIPTHPDRTAGLGFLAKSLNAFAPLLCCQGLLLSGVIASRVIYAGEPLASFKFDILGLLVVLLAIVVVPFTMFTPMLARTKRIGLIEYGALTQGLARQFDDKWLRGGSHEDLLTSADMQTLADMGNSFDVLQRMRLVPFGWMDLAFVAGWTIAPFVPLPLTTFPVDELVNRLVKFLL